jgi:hypothetical protein
MTHYSSDLEKEIRLSGSYIFRINMQVDNIDHVLLLLKNHDETHRKSELRLPGAALSIGSELENRLQELGAFNFEKEHMLRCRVPRRNLTTIERLIQGIEPNEVEAYDILNELFNSNNVSLEIGKNQSPITYLGPYIPEYAATAEMHGGRKIPTKRYWKIFNVDIIDKKLIKEIIRIAQDPENTFALLPLDELSGRTTTNKYICRKTGQDAVFINQHCVSLKKIGKVEVPIYGIREGWHTDTIGRVYTPPITKNYKRWLIENERNPFSNVLLIDTGNPTYLPFITSGFQGKGGIYIIVPKSRVLLDDIGNPRIYFNLYNPDYTDAIYFSTKKPPKIRVQHPQVAYSIGALSGFGTLLTSIVGGGLLGGGAYQILHSLEGSQMLTNIVSLVAASIGASIAGTYGSATMVKFYNDLIDLRRDYNRKEPIGLFDKQVGELEYRCDSSTTDRIHLEKAEQKVQTWKRGLTKDPTVIKFEYRYNINEGKVKAILGDSYDKFPNPILKANINIGAVMHGLSTGGPLVPYGGNPDEFEVYTISHGKKEAAVVHFNKDGITSILFRPDLLIKN